MQQQPNLLATKLFPPPSQSGVVARHRLTDRIDALAGAKLLLVSAPAGFGKTTLVASWAEAHGCPTAWVSLDRGDNDPARFLAYMLAAIEGLFPNLGEEASALLALTPPAPLQTILTSLLNDIAGNAEPFLLALDDYHEIENPDVHEILRFLLDHAPEQLRVAITTRVDPDLPLARYRVRGMLLELRAADLRFTAEEAGSFFSQRMGLTLSSEQLAMLEGRTEGWIAGLQMAALALQGRDSAEMESFIEAFSGTHRFVLEYLLEEVMDRLPKEVEQTLVKLSILDRFNASLCEGVTGSPSGSDLLREMDRANLFLIPLDSQREWYRYHHLFADLLQHRLRKLSPELKPELHRRAGLWFQRHGTVLEAGHHLYLAGDAKGLLNLIDARAREVFQDDDGFITYEWLSIVPDEDIRTHPRVAMVKAWGMRRPGMEEMMARQLTEIEENIHLVEPQADREEIVGEVEFARTLLAYRTGDYPATMTHGERALAIFNKLPATSGSQAPWNRSASFVTIFLGRAYRNIGDYLNAERTFLHALALRRAEKDRILIGTMLGVLARHRLSGGKLKLAEKESHEMLQLASELDHPAYANRATALAILATIHYERNEIDEARRAIDEAVELYASADISDRWRMVACFATLGELGLFCGDHERFTKAIEGLRGLPTSGDINPFTKIDSARVERRLFAMQAILDGRTDAVATWLAAYRDDPNANAGQYETRMQETLSALRCRIALGDDDLRDELEAFADEMAEHSLVRLAVETRLLLAIVHLRAGCRDQALAALTAALRAAAGERLIRVFINEGEEARALLDLFLDERAIAEISPTFLGELRRGFDGKTPPEPSEPAIIGNHTAVAELMLTERELDMLRLIAMGLTNSKIASKLYISQNTVKTHIYNLFAKLEVNSRIEAIARAREKGLIE